MSVETDASPDRGLAPQLLKHALAEHHLGALRDRETSTEAFRRHLRELSRLVLAEALRDLALEEREVRTPLGAATTIRCATPPLLVPVLRAALGMAEAGAEMIPGAQVRHLGIRRDERTLEPVSYYCRLEGAPPRGTCLLLDPMLATGGSAVAALDALRAWGAVDLRFVGLIGAPAGVRALRAAHPAVPIHLAALDPTLDDRGYIVPGLGDAGDRYFGTQ
ncbi:MAG: uracil phosphoribosyltransferase [Planctomycetota bacterium]|nr:uracil phosphoribosyltransferase [Planctomycetota bacterium]